MGPSPVRVRRRRPTMAAGIAILLWTCGATPFPAGAAASRSSGADGAGPPRTTSLASITAWSVVDYQYEAEATAGGIHEIPGVSVAFAAAAGSTTVLQARDLSTANVTPLVAGENIGNTFRGTCRSSDGTALAGERGVYWASNLVPPNETSVRPNVRWRFVAPASGTFRCSVSVASYSTIIGRDGRRVTMRIPAGASLVARRHARAGGATLPASGARTLAAGTTVTTLAHTRAVDLAAAATHVEVLADATVTTCKYLSSLCSGGVRGVGGTAVATWLEVQPLTAGGQACGTRRTSLPATAWLSNAKHHLTVVNTLRIAKSTLAGCATLAVRLRVRAAEGNPLYLHAGLHGGTAATRAIGYEHSAGG